MPRPKKNPLIRQKEFINVAKKLFISNGYESTSIKEIMSKVGKNCCSPSVFYYYFKSKENLYQVVIEEYLDDYISKIESFLDETSLEFDMKMFEFISLFVDAVLKMKDLIYKSSSVKNRSFILDLKTRITQRSIKIWEKILSELPWETDIDTEIASAYIVGGITEISYNFVFDKNIEDSKKSFIKNMDALVSNTLNMPQKIRNILSKKVERLYNG